MNQHQRRAVANHCRLSMETMHPRFHYYTSNNLSVVLTVNSGYE